MQLESCDKVDLLKESKIQCKYMKLRMVIYMTLFYSWNS